MSVKEHRMKLNLSQADLAEQVGVGQSAVAMWESGERKPKVEMLIKLSEIFNCTIDELIKNKNYEEQAELTS